MSERSSLRPTTSGQVARQAPWQRSQTQTLLLVAMITIVSLIIGSLYLAQATATATTGSQVIELTNERDRLARMNEDMISQIALKKNITTLVERAKKLGFVEAGPDDKDYVIVDGYTAVRATPTPAATLVPKTEYDETFEGAMRGFWSRLVVQFEQWSGNNRVATPAP